MMNIKSSLFYAALAACLGTGGVGGYVMSQRDIDHVRGEAIRAMQCDDGQKLDRTPRAISRGQSF
jgi:hypothetical protein